MTTYLITEAQIEEPRKVLPDNDWGQSLEDLLHSLPTPDTERCIQNLVVALVESKGWMRSYADAIIRDAIDRVHLTATAITADDVTPAMLQEWNKIFLDEDISIKCPKDGAIMAAAYNAVIKNRSEAK